MKRKVVIKIDIASIRNQGLLTDFSDSQAKIDAISAITLGVLKQNVKPARITEKNLHSPISPKLH